MYKIYIDATERYSKVVSLFKNDERLEEVDGDLDIVAVIKKLLEKHKIDIKEVEFDYNEGPGSFTGLKIASSISNTLNWAIGKKNIDELKYPKYGAKPNIHETKWIEK